MERNAQFADPLWTNVEITHLTSNSWGVLQKLSLCWLHQPEAKETSFICKYWLMLIYLNRNVHYTVTLCWWVRSCIPQCCWSGAALGGRVQTQRTPDHWALTTQRWAAIGAWLSPLRTSPHTPLLSESRTQRSEREVKREVKPGKRQLTNSTCTLLVTH